MCRCVGVREKPLLDSKRLGENKKRIDNALLVFFKAHIIRQRLTYKVFFSKELIQFWELYLSELQMALSFLEEHEKKLLEDCYQKKLGYKDMFFSKSNYYSCLNKYSDKFLKLFDYNFFLKCQLFEKEILDKREQNK
ncbi:hypothetical protein WEN_03255 [Mycoplasma wenyonii str. Massachusetts]|uniref:Uncharacterized protein n=1 Tax=Mycoplasma wenyonii (strain Massachusetts) TaxID=1197325 RepID=I6ZJP6_MYCWM|nr:hypothetical protein [Mycoplasma wenyonii]AFN65430.1 hypothetical protein WEN_03255 [Mycoplasma wenyonii str. Massachusetts]